VAFHLILLFLSHFDFGTLLTIFHKEVNLLEIKTFFSKLANIVLLVLNLVVRLDFLFESNKLIFARNMEVGLFLKLVF